jgi:hypothetical protein
MVLGKQMHPPTLFSNLSSPTGLKDNTGTNSIAVRFHTFEINLKPVIVVASVMK